MINDLMEQALVLLHEDALQDSIEMHTVNDLHFGESIINMRNSGVFGKFI